MPVRISNYEPYLIVQTQSDYTVCRDHRPVPAVHDVMVPPRVLKAEKILTRPVDAVNTVARTEYGSSG